MEKEIKITEAVNRMRKLGLYNQVINEFKNDQVVEYSEPTKLGGILYWVSNNPEWEQEIMKFESEYNGLVYHVIHSYTEFGELLNLLYVSDYEDEWEMENDDIEDGYVFSYVVNLDNPMFSEFGTIGVREAAGGLIRTA